jgi:hypothetical protein
MATDIPLAITDNDLPGLFRAADRASLDGQRAYTWGIRAELALMAIAAIFGAVSTVGPTNWQRASAALAVAALVVATLFRWVVRAERRNRAWFDGRAVAESVKTTAWRFMMHSEPYDRDDAAATEAFVSRLSAILNERRDLTLANPSIPQGDQITKGMVDARHLPFAQRRSLYVEQRLDNQAKWYSRRCGDHRRAARRLFWIGLSLQIAALGLAGLRIADLHAINLVGVMTTLVAAATALNQLHGHDELSRSYGLAAQELTTIKALVEVADEAAFPSKAAEAEGLISREHTLWMAKRA